jgi:predicted nucleic acid-binding protein
MMPLVLVDTPVWSLALRRKQTDLNASEEILCQKLAELIEQGRAQIMGAIRQEVLSGIREEVQFKKLRDHLRAFQQPSLDISDYEEAARMNNDCRARGIAGSAVDFLICAVAHRRRWQIFTIDRDFNRYRRVLGSKLFEVK